MSTLTQVSPLSISLLTAEPLVQLMRTLLKTECRYAKLNPTCLTISERLTIADGGIDAEILTPTNHHVPIDCFFQSGLSGIQIKAGASFKPWTESCIRNELINSAGELSSEVKRLVERKGRYILVCSGHDLTPEQRNGAKTHIASILNLNGFPNYENLIDVIGASQLAEFVERYPGTAALVISTAVEDGMLFDEWEQDNHLKNVFTISTEQMQTIEQICEGISGDCKHIRILGEPGIGKTRIVLEAVRQEEISTIALYIPHGVDFARTALFRSLLRKGWNDKPLVLVIDELPEYELAEIWRQLKGRWEHLKIISLDHGHDVARDESILRIQAPKLSNDAIKGILQNSFGREFSELERWVNMCGGSPRVAQAVAENLRAHPEDLFKPPAIVPIWDRFVHGYAAANSNLERQVNCVVQHLALFNRFGFEVPVQDEAAYIARMIERIDPTIGWAQFQEIVQRLRSRRVLQGKTTLFFVPQALHLYLWQQFWRNYGRGFDFNTFFSEMPESLHVWFMSMFKYANTDSLHVIQDILRPTGIYSNPAMLTSAKGAQFLSILTEADPSSVLLLLEATIAQWTDSELLNFVEHRQQIVWTLEKIAVWKRYALRAMKILSRLALNENGKNSNNATGTLIDFFSIGPETAVTELAPDARIPLFNELMQLGSDISQRLCLRIIEKAVDMTGLGWRIVGPEYQGLKERANLWAPQTYEELWQAKLHYFQQFVNLSKSCPITMQSEVCTTLLNIIRQLISCPPCSELAFQILENLLNESSMSASELNSFFSYWMDCMLSEERSEIDNRIKALRARFIRKNLKSRFQGYVLDVSYMEWDESFRLSTGKPFNHSKQLVDALAKRIAQHPEKLTEISPLLVSRESQSSGLAFWHFSEQLAKYDCDRILLSELINLSLKEYNDFCLRGYLGYIKEVDLTTFNNQLHSFLSVQETAWLGVSLILRSSFETANFDQCLEAFEKGWVEIGPFQLFCSGNTAKALNPDQQKRLLEILIADQSASSKDFIIELLTSFPFNECSPFTPEFIFDSIKWFGPDEITRGFFGHLWSSVCTKLLEWQPIMITALLNHLLELMKQSYSLTYDNTVSRLANEIVRMSPLEAWNVIHFHLELPDPISKHDLTNWLAGSISSFSESRTRTPIMDLPKVEILEWIEEDPQQRANIIALCVPKTLDDDSSGDLTREIISRYGQLKGVLSTITCRFHSGAWRGPRSENLKQQRNMVREWLTKGFSSEVDCWIEAELDYLDKQIVAEEIEEERNRFD